MKYILNHCCLVALLLLTVGCVTSQFQPIQNTTSVITPGDSSPVTVFLLERDLPPTFERLGTVAIRIESRLDTHKRVEEELQKIGREKSANGAIRVQHGTYELDGVPIVSYLLFRYPAK